MRNEAKRTVRKVKVRRTALGFLTILLVLVLAAAGCGEAATATPAPTAPTAAPEPTATTPPSEPATAEPDEPETTIRPLSEWTVENPATLEEIEAELEKHRGETLSFISEGGAFQAAIRRAWLDPMREKFGLEIVEESPGPGIARVRTQAETGNISWDIIDLGTDQVAALLKTDSLGEYDPAIVDARDLLDIVTAPGPYIAGGGITWSTILAYNTDVYPGDTGPKNWADFFDLENFPGRRSLRNEVSYGGQIQIQRLARNPELLNTPEGKREVATPSREQMEEDFAWFKEWTKEAGNDVIYWDTGSQCPEFLISGEVDMCTAWNGRIFDAQQTGAPLRICWECGFMTGTGGWTIAKGLKEQDPVRYELANLVVAWATFPQNNVRMAQFITYGPINKKSFVYMDAPEYDAVRDELPTSGANIPYSILWDEIWLGENLDWANEQYITATQ